jgi:hypothetical protein
VPAFGAAGRASKDGGEDGAAGEGEGDEAAEGDAVFGGPEIAPVVQLSEVPKQTGEEEEDALFAGKAVQEAVVKLMCSWCVDLLQTRSML